MSDKTVLMSLLAVGLVTGLCAAADLPISRVVLFSSGVGYFEREGQVQGDASVELSFRTEQIKDILKSLVLMDLSGGTIAPVTYSPRDPLERVLSSFSVNISDDPSLEELCKRLRGAKAEITAERTFQGVILGTETQQKIVDKEIIPFAVLNMMTDKGLVAIPLSQVQSLKLLDPKLEGELQTALSAIDKARDKDKRPVTLQFKGEGDRTVRVGYLLETPVWKTSYRLVSDKDGMFLQGWAVVENTGDDDWTNVDMALMSGRPVSFIQDLYEPLYIQRPVIPVQIAAAARPRIYEGAMDMPAPAPAEAAASIAPAAPTPRAGRRAEAKGDKGEADGMAAGISLGYMYTTGGAGGRGGGAMATGEKVGTLFQYAIDQPVSVPRQRSAMIPIIGEKVEGQKVSVFNVQADPKHPMSGLKLKNTSKLHLMGGPITVFDGGAYGGDALIEDIAPGEERLLTYAMDLEVEVDAQGKSQPDEILTAKIVRGVLVRQRKSRIEVTYTARNRSTDPRALLIEHALKPDWKLIEPAKADETTRSAYRLNLPLEAGKTGELTVREEMIRAEMVSLNEQNGDQVRLLVIQSGKISDALKDALGKLIALQAEQADLARQRGEKEARIKEIEAEQARIRQNMEQLDKQSQLYKQYVEKFAGQEAEFETLRGEIKTLRDSETAKTKQIQDYIAGLDVE